MPRAGRSFEEGRTYHVYNRVAGGLRPFEDEGLAGQFVELLRKVVERDGATVLAWCLLGNQYHIVVRQGPVELSRSMKTLQQGVTRARDASRSRQGGVGRSGPECGRCLATGPDRPGGDRALRGEGDGAGGRAGEVERRGQQMVSAWGTTTSDRCGLQGCCGGAGRIRERGAVRA